MNLNAEFKTIAELDLDSIKVKLMHKESGEGWSLEQANAVEFEYRRFLCIIKLFPDAQTAPLLAVDTFWHYHILDTMKYAADCEQIFGYFLHHSPDKGLRSEDDEAVHNRSGARMQELYEATFGEPYVRQGEGHAVTASSQSETTWCTPATPKAAAWCTPATPKAAAWCTPATPKAAAWCTPATPNAAWYTPATPKAAAWCTPATPKAAAWCTPATPKPAAWCTPATPRAAWRPVFAEAA
jgi:hypothetical protein